MQNAEQMSMTQASPQLLLGPGVLGDAVTAAMHAVQPGSMYWGEPPAQPGPNISSQDMSAHPDALHQDNGLPAQLAGRHVCVMSLSWSFATQQQAGIFVRPHLCYMVSTFAASV